MKDGKRMTVRSSHANKMEPWKLEVVIRGEGRSDGRTVAGVVGRTMRGASRSPLSQPDGFWVWTGDGLGVVELEQCLDALAEVRGALCRRLAEAWACEDSTADGV